MDRTRVDLLRAIRWLAPFAVLAAVGCQTVRTPEEQIAATPIPREKNMTSMPDYVVSPPDLLLVEVLTTAVGRPITGERLVRPDGTITLGWYGDVYVAGLTVPEIKEKIIIHLRNFLSDEALGLVADVEGENAKPISPRDSDTVFVDVSAYNSQVYYVTGDVNAPGRIPITGNDTVLDALMYAGGLAPTASIPNVRLVRPAPPGSAKPQLLPVNIAAILQEGDTTTNYQLMPGDRLHVYRDPIVRGTILVDRLAAPFNTVISSILNYSFAARNVQSIGIPINGGFGGNTGSRANQGFNQVPNNTPAR